VPDTAGRIARETNLCHRESGALGDAALAVAGGHPDNAAAAVAVSISVWSVDRIAIERISHDRRVLR